MIKKRFLIYPVFLLIFSGCASQKNNKPAAYNPYKRAELTEIPEKRLELDATLIDAKTQKELGFSEKAMEMYQNLLKQDSTYTVAWFDLGELYFSILEFDKAIKHTRNAVRLSPENIWYRLQLAEIFMQLYQFGNAANELEAIVKLVPDEMIYYYEWANALILSENPEGAIKVLNLLEKRIGPNEEISAQRQKIWIRMGKHEKIIEENEKLLKLYPNEIKYNAILAEIYMSQKKYSKAYPYYANVKRISPSNMYIDVSLAEYYKAVGDQEKAYLSLKDAFKNPELDIASKTQILFSFYPLTDFFTTYRDYTFDLTKVLYEEDSTNRQILTLYGDVMLRSEKYQEANSAFLAISKIDSSVYEIQEAIIMSANLLNDTAMVLSESEKAMRLFPSQPLPYYFHGIALMQYKEPNRAIDVFQKGIRWIVEDTALLTGFYSTLGECYYEIKDDENTDVYFGKALELDPTNLGLLNNYAYYLSERKEKLDEAEAMSKQTILKSPENPTFLDTYAWVLFQQGKYAEALPYMQTAMQKDEAPNGVVLEHYADILFKNNKIEEAKIYWKKALEAGEGSDRLPEKIEKGIWIE